MSATTKNALGDIPPEVAEKLGYYVYLYTDPRDEQVRYVGKGVGTRAIQHLTERKESKKVNWLAELRRLNIKPRIEILARNLASEQEALLVERCVIDAIGIPPLKNVVRGHDSEHGRELLEEIIIRGSAEEAVIRHPVLMFHISKEYQGNLGQTKMSQKEIYELTRHRWVIGKERREKAQYALVVYKEVVRGVFCIDGWEQEYTKSGVLRWTFSSTSKVPSKVMKQYLHKSVRKYYFKKKAPRNPVIYAEGSNP